MKTNTLLELFWELLTNLADFKAFLKEFTWAKISLCVCDLAMHFYENAIMLSNMFTQTFRGRLSHTSSLVRCFLSYRHLLEFTWDETWVRLPLVAIVLESSPSNPNNFVCIFNRINCLYSTCHYELIIIIKNKGMSPRSNHQNNVPHILEGESPVEHFFGSVQNYNIYLNSTKCSFANNWFRFHRIRKKSNFM